MIESFYIAFNEALRSVGPVAFWVGIFGLIYCFFIRSKFSFLLLIPLVSYILFYILPSITIVPRPRFRDFLPLWIILSIYSGKLISDIFYFKSKIGIILKTLVVVLFAWLFILAGSFTLLFLNDPRYSAETFIKKNIPKNSSIEIFDTSLLYAPRFFENYTISKKQFTDEYEFNPTEFRKRNPDIVILVITFDLDSKHKIFKNANSLYTYLLDKNSGYKLIGDFKANDTFGTNPIMYFNPQVLIFKNNELNNEN